MVNGMGQRHLDERVVGEDARDLAAERLVHPIVVVGVQEPALLEVAAQDLHLVVREMDVAVSPHEQVGNVPQLGRFERHHALAVGHGERSALPNGGEEVGEGGRAGVPVAAAVVVQAADGERSGGR